MVYDREAPKRRKDKQRTMKQKRRNKSWAVIFTADKGEFREGRTEERRALDNSKQNNSQ